MEEVNILFFGDSITYGANDLETGGWVNRLRLYLDKKYDYDVNVFNLGISGEISAETLDRFDFECKARLRGGRPIVVFAVGINDTQDVNGSDRVTLKQFEGNIEKLIEKAKKFTDEIIFIGLTRVDEPKVKNRFSRSAQKYKSYFNKKIIEFDNCIEHICIGQGVLYIKTFDLLTEKELSDGLHPNSAGHEILFTHILSELEKLIRVETNSF